MEDYYEVIRFIIITLTIIKGKDLETDRQYIKMVDY